MHAPLNHQQHTHTHTGFEAAFVYMELYTGAALGPIAVCVCVCVCMLLVVECIAISLTIYVTYVWVHLCRCQALVYIVIDTRDIYHCTLNHKQHAQAVGPKAAIVTELPVAQSAQAHASHTSGRKRQSSEEVFLPAGLKCFVT